MSTINNYEIICGNSDEILPSYIAQGKKFDLILTDPPYNINKDFGNDSDRMGFEEYIEITKKRIGYCRDLLTPTGSLVWFGIHRYIGYIQIIMYEAGLYYRRMNIWYYENGFSRNKNLPTAQYEPFLWFSKAEKEWVYNYDDVRVPYKSTNRIKTPVFYLSASGEKKQWLPNSKGALRGDIWKYPTLAGNSFKKERTSHPTQKPEGLIIDIIKAFCPKNEKGCFEGRILDPFFGVGTTGVCAEMLNRCGNKIKWDGIELEDRWCDIAKTRIGKIK